MRILQVSLFFLILASNWAVATEGNVGSSFLKVSQLPLALGPSKWLICPTRNAFSRKINQNCQPLEQADLSSPINQTSIVLKLQLSLDHSIKSTGMGIAIDNLLGADKLYLNGQQIAYTGNLPPRFSGASLYPRRYRLPHHLLMFNQPNILELEIYHPGGYEFLPSLNIKLTSLDALIQQLFVDEIKFFVIAGMMLIIVLLKLHYYFRIPGSYETLALSMYCLFSAIAIVLNSQWLLSMGFDANSLLRFKTAFFVFSQLCLSYFLFIALNLKAHLKLRVVLFGYLVLGIIILVWPKVAHLQTLHELSLYTALGITLILPITSTVSAINKNSKPRYYLLSGLLIYALCLSIELFRNNPLFNLNLGFQTVLPLGLLITGVLGSWWATDNYWKFFKGAVNDHLTGTLLKNAFIGRLTEEMQRSERHSHALLIAILDIDQFKLINQNYGHDLGDKVLLQVANTLTKQLRSFDLISRISDDEFCIAVNMPENRQNNGLFLQRLHDELNHIGITLENEQTLNVQITTGAVIYNNNRHRSPEMLLHDAEHAVTDAKMKQRGAIQWFDTKNPPIEFVV